MADRKLAFTKTALSKIQPPKKGRLYVYDTKLPGLALCVTAAGSRSFYWYKWTNGKPLRVRIGGFPEWTVAQARKQAAGYTVDVARGGNPQEKK